MSNQRTISLDRRRIEQLQILAEKQGVRSTEWIERHIADAWSREFPNEPVPGVRVSWVKYEGAPVVEIHLNVDSDHGDDGTLNGPITVSPQVALKLAFGLRGITLREITNFKTAIDHPGTELTVHIRRRGQGVVWRTLEEGRFDPCNGGHSRGGVAATPALALEIADCIERMAQQAMGIVSEGERVADAVRPASGEGASPPVDRGPDWGTW